jgi:hypothetical protein
MGKGTAVEMKGYEMILQDENHILYYWKHCCFVVVAVKTLSVSLQNTVSNFGVGWYRTINLFYTK